MTAHTDHPMRNWDRTCPACQEKYEKVTEKGKKYLEIYGYMPWSISYAEALDAGQVLNKKDLANAFREAQEKIDQLTAMTKEPTKLMAIPELMEAAGWVRIEKLREEYERGVIDGRNQQMKSSVDRAVNAMVKKEWVGLPDMQVFELADEHLYGGKNYGILSFYKAIEAKLKEKNL